MKSWETLYSIAEGNFGVVTYAEAKRIGVGIREIDRWIDAGRLERVARGVYRVSAIAPSDLDVFAVAVETIGPEAYLYGESVIAMLHLAPTNPTWLYVASPKRVRKTVSANLKVVRGDVGYEFTNYDGIRSQRLEDAIRAQDLIDLQLMMSHEEVDLSEIRSICKRLFANRKKHQWPAKLNVDTEEWRLAYERIKGELPVLPTVEEAVAWVNELIDRIAKSVKEEKRK